MLLELDIFSGRENPRWELDEHTARRLEALHRNLRPTDDRPPEPPGLGYRGFLYELDDATWRALRGVVAGPAAVLADPTRSVERLLVDQLPTEYRDLGPIILADIERTA